MPGSRLKAGMYVMLSSFLAILLFALVNYLAGRHFERFDLTKGRMYSLSDKTLSVLQALDQPLTVTFFYQPDHPLYERITDLIKAYERVSPRIAVEKVDPHRDIAKARQLAEKFKVEALNVVVFECGDRSKYVTENDSAEYDMTAYVQGGAPRLVAFKAEEAFTSAILSVTGDERPIIHFTTGHGEKAHDDTGLGGVSKAAKLLEQDNMEVGPLMLAGQEALTPEEVDCLIIAGPDRKFSDEELARIGAYLDAGGAVLALLDPLVESGLEPVGLKWGIEIGANVVVDPTQKLPFVSASNVIISNYSQHVIVKDLFAVATLFPLVRGVKPGPNIEEGIECERLAFTTQGGWAETDLSNTTFVFEEGKDEKGPVSVAAASRKGATRLVVIGDSDFASNSQIANLGNGDFFQNAVNWLVAREDLISVSPKMALDMHLNLTEREMAHAFWQSVVFLPVLSLAIGGAVLWRRRS